MGREALGLQCKSDTCESERGRVQTGEEETQSQQGSVSSVGRASAKTAHRGVSHWEEIAILHTSALLSLQGAVGEEIGLHLNTGADRAGIPFLLAASPLSGDL